MFKTIVNALKIRDVRLRILYTVFALFIVRLGCQIPVPGVNRVAIMQEGEVKKILGPDEFNDAETMLKYSIGG